LENQQNTTEILVYRDNSTIKSEYPKNEKKELPIVADEFNLLTMTPEEQQKAHEDYRKKYRYLKRALLLLIHSTMISI
jgi:hypothetical protein